MNSARLLIFHGSIIFFFGMIFGYPYGRKLASRKATTEEKDAWRLAHSSISGGGTSLIAIGAALPLLNVGLNTMIVRFTAYFFIISLYSFLIGVFLAAVLKQRGLRLQGTLANRIVFGVYSVAASTAMIGGLLLILNAWR